MFLPPTPSPRDFSIDGAFSRNLPISPSPQASSPSRVGTMTGTFRSLNSTLPLLGVSVSGYPSPTLIVRLPPPSFVLFNSGPGFISLVEAHYYCKNGQLPGLSSCFYSLPPSPLPSPLSLTLKPYRTQLHSPTTFSRTIYLEVILQLSGSDVYLRLLAPCPLLSSSSDALLGFVVDLLASEHHRSWFKFIVPMFYVQHHYVFRTCYYWCGG